MNDDAALILIVEDEPKLAALHQDYMQAAGYRTAIIDDGRDAVPWVREHGPDLIILDLMLPGKDGIEICRELRTFSQLPIIMVTARVDEIDRLLGLELGADDYVCKPFKPREVVARVKAQLRRLSWAAAPETQPESRLVVDRERFEARVDGNVIELTPVEFRLLAHLAAQPGRVFSREQLMRALYTDHRVVTDRTIDTHVKNVRRKLQAALPDPEDEAIRSVYGVGYKFVLPE